MSPSFCAYGPFPLQVFLSQLSIDAIGIESQLIPDPKSAL
jgi:hypothetical protein